MTRTSHVILVVDDEEDFRLVLRDHFEDLGYEVEEAADGQQALEIFEQSPRRFDLVITDIRMPRLSGEELIAELRERRRHLPIIGVTGHADLSGRLALFDQGAYYYLDKPLPHWPIVDRLVENAIRLHRYEEEVELLRAKEYEIAQLLRAYILKTTSEQTAIPGPDCCTIDLDIAIWYVESDRPAGDYVEWFRRTDREVVFYVADASGHADLLSCFMSCLASMVIHRAHHGGRPGVDRIIRELDAALGQLREAGALGHERHLTFFLGVVDLETGEMSYVNAGHPEALLLHREGAAAQRLGSNSRPVGFLFDQPPEVGRLTLAPDDVLFVYTDGASELLEHGPHLSKTGDPGVDQLEAEASRWTASPAREIVDRVADFLGQCADGAAFPDDTTLLAIKVGESGSGR